MFAVWYPSQDGLNLDFKHFDCLVDAIDHAKAVAEADGVSVDISEMHEV